MPWYVLYTKSRQEKKVTEALNLLGVNAYCPVVTTMKQWSDRKKKVEEPLIKSYVFVNLDESNRDIVFEVPGVVRYLFWLGKPAVVRDVEIEALQRNLNGIITSFEIMTVSKGSNYSITEGPFKGLEGIVTRVNKSSIQIILKELGFLITINS